MNELVFSVQEFLKIVPGLVIFPLSLYLAWKKIGIKVTASYTTQHQRIVAPRISKVVLMNQKDKALTVFAIYAVMDREITWEIDKFDPPIVLKPLESTCIETQPYSQLTLGADNFEPEFIPPYNIEIYIVLSHKVVKCEPVTHPTLLNISMFQEYRSASKHIKRFNDIVYNDYAAYAITYVIGSEIKTAIVDRAGFISCNWNFHFNAIPPEFMATEDEVRKYLERLQFEKFVKTFAVDVLK